MFAYIENIIKGKPAVMNIPGQKTPYAINWNSSLSVPDVRPCLYPNNYCSSKVGPFCL